MQRWIRRLAATLALALLVCVWSAVAEAGEHPTIDPKVGWRSLFDGKTLAGWELKDTKGRKAPDGTWVVEDGVLARKGPAYLWSTKQFGDFILDLEFKVSSGCNSGIIVRHKPHPKQKSYWWDGLLEVQILDSYGKSKPDMHDCGALYDMVAPSKNTMKKPGQWNRATITAKGSKIAVVLNGEKIIDADLDDWTEAGKNPDGTPNKYHKPMKNLSRRGFILLQDHGHPIWFRNIHLKPLD